MSQPASETDLVEKLHRALEFSQGTHSAEDVAQAVLEGRAQAWQRDGALVVTEIIHAPQKRVLGFWLAAGELEPVLDLTEELYDWGRENGCVSAQMLGRKGWTKPLKEHGWTPGLIQFTKEL